MKAFEFSTVAFCMRVFDRVHQSDRTAGKGWSLKENKQPHVKINKLVVKYTTSWFIKATSFKKIEFWGWRILFEIEGRSVTEMYDRGDGESSV
jgi:hypothetical protein